MNRLERPPSSTPEKKENLSQPVNLTIREWEGAKSAVSGHEAKLENTKKDLALSKPLRQIEQQQEMDESIIAAISEIIPNTITNETQNENRSLTFSVPQIAQISIALSSQEQAYLTWLRDGKATKEEVYHKIEWSRELQKKVESSLLN